MTIQASRPAPPRRPGASGAPRAAAAAGRDERLLEQLETIFLRDGFREVTVEHLARTLRCSRRTLYELAPSKEALFLRVFDRYLSRLREEGAQAARTARPEQALAPYLAPAVVAASKLSATLIRDMSEYPPASEMWERHRRERMAGLRQLVERCVEQGIFRRANATLVAEVFDASLRRICDPAFLAGSGLTYRQALAELYGLLLDGLLREESGRGGEPGRGAESVRGGAGTGLR